MSGDCANCKSVIGNLPLTGGGGSGGGGIIFNDAWRFSTSTVDADPGSGRFRFNNATQSSATFIYISEESRNGVDFSNIIAGLTNGDRLYIQEGSDATRFHLFVVTGSPTDATTYYKIPVTVEDSGADLTNNTECGVVFYYTGAVSAHAPTHEPGGDDLVTKRHLAKPASLNGYSGDTDLVTIDTNPGIGKVVYKKSNGAWESALATAESTMGQLALVLEVGTGVDKRVLLDGKFNDGASAALVGGTGDLLYVSRTVAGDYVNKASRPTTSGDIVQCVGERETADVIRFQPARNWYEVV